MIDVAEGEEMNLVKGTQYQVASSHCFHANRIGRFEFLGGPDRDVIVLSEPLDSRHLFAVGLHDIISFDPKKDNISKFSITV